MPASTTPMPPSSSRLSIGGITTCLRALGYTVSKSWTYRQGVTPSYPKATTARFSWGDLEKFIALAEEARK
jgi:hypothetical protein